MADLPHFASPFRASGSSFGTVDQDSTDDILGCVETILRTEVGTRDELPEFGVEDLAFGDGETVESDVVDAVTEWEPRVAASATAEEIEDMIMKVEASIDG